MSEDGTVADHPRMFVTRDPSRELLSVEELRKKVTAGRPAELWAGIQKRVEKDEKRVPIRPDTPLPNRGEVAVDDGIVDAQVMRHAGSLLRSAGIAWLLTEEDRYAELALEQLRAMFEEDQWPLWQARYHYEEFGLTADIRTGRLARDVAVAYDWLYPALTPDQREWVLEGLDRRGVQAYLQALADDAWWADDEYSNWMTQTVGALGTVGMILDGEHPEAGRLIEYAEPRMDAYVDLIGPEGEFNESVGYGGAIIQAIIYYLSSHYHDPRGDEAILPESIVEMSRWLLYGTASDGQYVLFGDAGLDSPVRTEFLPAVAAVAGDPVLQWYYERFSTPEGLRDRPYELLWYDDSLGTTHPDGSLPLGRAYERYGGLISSRSSWDPEAASIVHSKAGIEPHHQHHDAGQVCIDGYGCRLVRDLGSPPGYPADYFTEQRWEYYNASTHGHNVLEFGDGGMAPEWEEPREGTVLGAAFDDDAGGWWRLDLSAMYDRASQVTRTVVHLLPRTIVVLDEARLAEAHPISLRYHTAPDVSLEADGRFTTSVGQVSLRGRVVGLDAPSITRRVDQHEYEAPYDRARSGEPLEQRREPFLEAALEPTDSCRLLSTFSIVGPEQSGGSWTGSGPWGMDTAEEAISVRLEDGALSVADAENSTSWRVDV